MGKNRSLSTAIHILAALGVNDHRLVNSEDLATSLKTNPGLIRRVLVKLSQNDLVESVKGKGGGNRLAKTPDKINLKDIYLAVKEGPLIGSFDKVPFEPCMVSCNIGRVLTDVYDGLENDLITSMRKVKLSKIIRDLA